MSRTMNEVASQDQFDAMIQGLRDSADLLNGSMATVRFVASALLD